MFSSNFLIINLLFVSSSPDIDILLPLLSIIQVSIQPSKSASQVPIIGDVLLFVAQEFNDIKVIIKVIFLS